MWNFQQQSWGHSLAHSAERKSLRVYLFCLSAFCFLQNISYIHFIDRWGNCTFSWHRGYCCEVQWDGGDLSRSEWDRKFTSNLTPVLSFHVMIFTLNYFITLLVFGRCSYAERHTTKCKLITRDKCAETPGGKYHYRTTKRRAWAYIYLFFIHLTMDYI